MMYLAVYVISWFMSFYLTFRFYDNYSVITNQTYNIFDALFTENIADLFDFCIRILFILMPVIMLLTFLVIYEDFNGRTYRFVVNIKGSDGNEAALLELKKIITYRGFKPAFVERGNEVWFNREEDALLFKMSL